MLVAYVSDERYVALPEVLLEFEGAAGSFETRSPRIRPAAPRPACRFPYKVTLQKPGFGAKSIRLNIAEGQPPHHLRLLSDGLLGYAWPKSVKAG